MKEVFAALVFLLLSFVSLSRVPPLGSQSLIYNIDAELSCLNIHFAPASHLFDVLTDCSEPHRSGNY